MANPSAAHEPSMEEILASIRQIISEDGDDSTGSDDKSGEGGAAMAFAAEETEAELEEAMAEPEEAAADPEPEPDPEPETFEAEAAADPEPQFEPEFEPQFEPDPEPEPEPVTAFAHGESMTPQSSAAEAESFTPFAQPAAASSRGASRDDQSLMSTESDQAVHGAFSALAHTILAQNARTLEDLVAEMLQPMLKNWLDDNLPALVERLVQEEIQRVSRGRP